MQEKKAEEERLARQEVDADFMAPFLAMLGDPDIDTLTLDQAHRLREMCLIDYKQQLVNRAQLVHDRFEKVSSCKHKKAAGYRIDDRAMRRQK